MQVLSNTESAKQYLENCRSRNAVREQIIQLRADLQDSGRRSLFNHLLCNDLDERLPIRRRYGSLL